jgi:hypothetical protein
VSRRPVQRTRGVAGQKYLSACAAGFLRGRTRKEQGLP